MVDRYVTRRTFALFAGTSAALAAGRGGRAQSQDSPATTTDAPRGGPVEAEFERDYPAPDFKPGWKKPQINRQMVEDFVIFAHSDIDRVRQLLDRELGLLNAAIDWGGGDFETALGGASHMGRRDIVEVLLGRGARIDLFCAAMLGHLSAIEEFLTRQPTLIDARGPHGFSLHFHAQVGGEEAKPVLDYLQSIKQVELRPIPFLSK